MITRSAKENSFKGALFVHFFPINFLESKYYILFETMVNTCISLYSTCSFLQPLLSTIDNNESFWIFPLLISKQTKK